MSEVKVNKISPRSGTDVTLGDSGDTFTLPSGGTIAIAAGATINNQGTAVNFGATGSASWVTTVKTGDFTAVAGEGYFVNTTSGEIDVALPAGTAGAVVAVKDYAGTFDTNQCILVPNGSDKIGSIASNAFLTTEGLAVTLVFVDSTQGWLVTDSGLQSEAPGPQYIVATGGTITTSGNFKIHTFTGTSSLNVTSVGNASGSNTVSYVVVGGGAGGGYLHSGGGGAGGFRESKAASDSYTASPLNATSGPTYNLPVSVQSYPVTVGGGGGAGTCGPFTGASGGPSTFSTITSLGGGGGAGGPNGGTGGNGGAGGGGASNGGNPTAGSNKGFGNTPPVAPPQGKDGGNSLTAPTANAGAGGGGATVAGVNSQIWPSGGGTGGAGGTGATTQINPAAGSPATNFSGGGGGGGTPSGGPSAPGGTGGGAGGSYGSNPISAGVVNTGGGGGGTGPTSGPVRSTAGGSGIVIIRYKFQ